MVAGRYGSVGADGVSFTEMEYDYAVAQGKPAIGFVHGEPGEIAASKTETSEKARAKLRSFVEKIKKRPVRQFRNPHELALEVTTSFVQLIRDRPAVGYVRTDQAVDFKRYSELLEENNKLKEDLSAAQQSLETAPFPTHDKKIRLYFTGEKDVQGVECLLWHAFRAVAEGALRFDNEYDVLNYAANLLLDHPDERNDGLSFHETSMRMLRRELLLQDLIEIHDEQRTSSMPGLPPSTFTTTIWRLTDYGRRQLAAIAP